MIALQGAEGLGPSDVVIKLADSSAFDAAGIERPYFLTGLQSPGGGEPPTDGARKVIAAGARALP
ncbi:hypothetical protein UMZ34_24890 [Halopseudomonas pachastrellae]|nr:hypothetical protein UMZ34_24890 [Halopseudomonas pachastrellae]